METKYRDRLGTSTFKAFTFLDDGADVYADYGASEEHDTLAGAQSWAETILALAPVHDGESGGWWARIEKGTYVDDSFIDEGLGRILHASWEPGEGDVVHVWVASAAVPVWDEL